LKKDLFRVAYHSAHVTPERILETVRAKGFRAEIVPNAPATASPTRAQRRNLGRLPGQLQEAVQQARKERKALLLAFHGPACPPCRRMSAVTYSDTRVKQELACWVLVQVDVADHPEVAGLFEVAAIPVAVAVTADGVELGRVENFVEPAAFRARLERMRLRKAVTLGPTR
jgi:thiol:disulfide interchange protein